MTNKKIICFGEVLWDVVADNRLIGGAPLNVCYHLSKFGVDSKVISQVGEDSYGTDLIQGISKLGVNTSLITISPNYATSKVLVHITKKGEISYEIVENVAWDFIQFDEKIAQEIAKANYFVYGSLSTRNEVSKSTLLRYLEYSNWNVLDLNLRYPYYDQKIIHQLLSSCNTLKINDEELLVISDLFFKNSHPDQRIESVFKIFSNINEVIVTKGAEGVSYYSKEEAVEIPGIKVQVADTVGSGDSFLAAYLAGRLHHKPIIKCLKDAVVLSAFIASRQGACPVYSLEEIEQFSVSK